VKALKKMMAREVSLDDILANFASMDEELPIPKGIEFAEYCERILKRGLVANLDEANQDFKNLKPSVGKINVPNR